MPTFGKIFHFHQMLSNFLNIAPLFILILIGFLLAKIRLSDANWTRVLNAYSLNIGFPCLIFYGLTQKNISILDYKNVILANSIFLILCFFICFGLATFINGPLKRTLPICLTFSNIAFLGIPILKQIYGEQSVAETGIISSCYLFWVFTIGIGHLEYHKLGKIDLKEISLNLLKNPLLIAVLLGTIVNLSEWKIPTLLFLPIDMIAKSVTPLVSISLGTFMYSISFRKEKNNLLIFIFTISSLLIIPCILWLCLLFLNLDIKTYKLSILEAAMPVALTPFALAEKYNLDQEFIAKIIVVSTILSIFSISFWASIL